MSETILLVEDDLAIAEMVEDALSRGGFDCARAEDAAQAEQAIRRERPALVLMDWMLPGVSGVELVRRLRPDRRKVFPGGVGVLSACFQSLGVEHMSDLEGERNGWRFR